MEPVKTYKLCTFLKWVWYFHLFYHRALSLHKHTHAHAHTTHLSHVIALMSRLLAFSILFMQKLVPPCNIGYASVLAYCLSQFYSMSFTVDKSFVFYSLIPHSSYVFIPPSPFCILFIYFTNVNCCFARMHEIGLL